MDPVLIVLIVVVILSILYGLLKLQLHAKKVNQLKGYTYVKRGMRVKDMLAIMGPRYSRSILKDGTRKYEWRINASTKKSFISGSKSYSGVKKVTVYAKKGVVTGVKTHNI